MDGKEGPIKGISESRFAILGTEDTNNTEELHEPCKAAKKETLVINSMRRGKRSAVQVTESQTANDYPVQLSPRNNQQRYYRSIPANSPERSNITTRQVAAEVEHVVVRGSKNGENTSIMVVNYDEGILFVPETNEENMGKQFQDPPSPGFNPLT